MYIDRCNPKQKEVFGTIRKAQRIAVGVQRVDISGWHMGVKWEKGCKLFDQNLALYFANSTNYYSSSISYSQIASG